MNDRDLYDLLDQLDQATGILICDLDGADFREALQRTLDRPDAQAGPLIAAERGWFVIIPRPSVGREYRGPYPTSQHALVRAVTTLWNRAQEYRAML